jgi:hypothetical protein
MALVRAGWVVTAVREGTGDLKAIAWDIHNSGDTVTRRGSAEAGRVSAIASCSLGMNMVATAVRDGGNDSFGLPSTLSPRPWLLDSQVRSSPPSSSVPT